VEILPIAQTQRMAYCQAVNKKAIAEVMRYLGSRTSAAKAKAARKNGKLGGRPRKDKRQ
jgi:hypothetical protein